MRITFPILCGIVAALFAAPVDAQEELSDSGLYFSLGGGISDGSFVGNEWVGTDPLTGNTTTFLFDYSLAGTGAIGYSWHPSDRGAGFRIELEGSYRRAEVYSAVEDWVPNILTADGYLESIGAMANGYVDFNIGESATTYFGGGIGAARVSRRDFVLSGVPLSNKYVHTAAWQMMGGIGYRYTPGMIIGLEFRHFKLHDFTFENTPLIQEIQFDEVFITLRFVG